MDASSHNNGNVMGITNLVDGTRSQQFTYDQLNRLLTAESTSTYATSPAHCWGEAYVYDNSPTTPGEYGNLTNINVASTAYNGCTQESLSVAANTQYNNNQITAFSYDASGNTLNDTHNSYTWNAESEIKTAAGVTYTYDGDGNRVQKSNGKIYWYGAGSQVLDESDASGNITDEYVFFGGKRIAHRVVSGNVISYYGEDFLGTSRQIYTSASVLCYDADFYPFGGERPYTNTCPQNYKFTGKERDAESGLDNFGARYFGSSMGRFTSADPLLSSGNPGTPQTWNRYAYALNNPLRIVDPTGLWDWDQSAGGDMSDEDLQAIANDKHNKRHKWAQGALNFRDQFRDALDAANEAAGNSSLSDDQQSAAQAAVDAYGTEGDSNGVTVGSHSGYGATTLLNDNDTFSVKFGSGDKGTFLAATILHEGVHIDQGNAWLNGGESSVADINHYFREQQAWTLEGMVARALGMNSLAPHGGGKEFQVWNKGWKAADVETMRSRGVANILNYMNLKPTDTDTYSNEHQHKDQ